MWGHIRKEEEEEEEEEEKQMECKQRLLKMPNKFRFQVKSKNYYTFLDDRLYFSGLYFSLNYRKLSQE